MKSELFYFNHPRRTRIFWALVYILLAVLFIFGLYVAASRIRTHTLPVGQVQLKIPYSKYLVGEAVTFSVTNNYNSSIYVLNNCPAEPLAVFYLENDTWIRQHDQASLSDCSGEERQVSVPANGVVNGSFAPWHTLFARPGKYRVVAFVEHYNALPYQEFEVVATPINVTNPAPPSVAPLPTPTQQTPTIPPDTDQNND